MNGRAIVTKLSGSGADRQGFERAHEDASPVARNGPGQCDMTRAREQFFEGDARLESAEWSADA